MPGPERVLHRKRLVETVEGAHLRLQFERGICRQDGGERIAGGDMDEHEADDADPDRDGYDMQKPFKGVDEHELLRKT
ncbi:hypothetical protein D3C80_864930 [compost metagenome]